MHSLLSPVDPDVGGPGVVFGFILTGATTLVISIILLRLETHLKNSQAQDQPRSIFIKALAKTLAPRRTSNPLKFWKSVLERLVLGLSDQQLLTGLLTLAISLYNYGELNNQNNLYSAANLAYFSSITHAATLLALRAYFRRYFWMTLFRLLLTGASFILWAFIAIREIDNSFNEGDGEPLWFPPTLGGALLAEVVGLAWVYWSLGLSLYVSDKALLARAAISRRRSKRDLTDTPAWLDEMKENGGKFAGSLSGLYNVYSHTTSTGLCIIIWTAAEIVFPWVVLFPLLIFLFSVGLLILVLNVISNSGLGSSWGFGQLLPLFLILLPFYQLVETFVEERNPEEETPVTQPLSLPSPIPNSK